MVYNTPTKTDNRAKNSASITCTKNAHLKMNLGLEQQTFGWWHEIAGQQKEIDGKSIKLNASVGCRYGTPKQWRTNVNIWIDYQRISTKLALPGVSLKCDI